MGRSDLWFYISFATEDEFLGGVFVKSENPEAAIARTHELGINPGGEACLIGPVFDDEVKANVPPEGREKLLSVQVMEQLGQEPVNLYE